MFNWNWSDWVDVGYEREYRSLWGNLYFIQYQTNESNGAKRFRKVLVSRHYPPHQRTPDTPTPEENQ